MYAYKIIIGKFDNISGLSELNVGHRMIFNNEMIICDIKYI